MHALPLHKGLETGLRGSLGGEQEHGVGGIFPQQGLGQSEQQEARELKKISMLCISETFQQG